MGDDLAMEYDVLVISSACQDMTYRTIPALKGNHEKDLAANGIHGLGSAASDTNAMNWIQGNLSEATKEAGWTAKTSDDIVVVGSNIYAWNAIGILMNNIGISPTRIVWLTGKNGPGSLGHEAIDEIAIN